MSSLRNVGFRVEFGCERERGLGSNADGRDVGEAESTPEKRAILDELTSGGEKHRLRY